MGAQCQHSNCLSPPPVPASLVTTVGALMESQWLSLLVMEDPFLLVPFLYEKTFAGTKVMANPCFLGTGPWSRRQGTG